MGRFEQLRDRLPTLYRPEDDAADGELLPFRAADLLEVNGAAPPAGAVTDSPTGVLLRLAQPLVLREVRLSSAPGSIAALEVYPILAGRPTELPQRVAPVREQRARLERPLAGAEFALRLRRPPLIAAFLRAVAEELEEINRAASGVMRSHWLEHADRALFDPYFNRKRVLKNEPLPTAEDPAVRTFPFIHDLAYLAGLLALAPWRDPPAQREGVEAFRERVRRTVQLYRSGLGTPQALRAAVQTALPRNLLEGEGLRDRPFTLEEFPQVRTVQAPAAGHGAPADRVGPLMRWPLENPGLAAAAPTLYIEGVEPVPDRVDATLRPLVELFAVGARRVRLGLAYEGSLAAGEVLRVRPVYSCWLGGPEGLVRSDSPPGAAEPPAAGPWNPVPDAPAGAVRALLQSEDHTLWAAVDAGGAGALWQFDGREWREVLPGLPPVHCLAADGAALLVGTERGLLRLPLYPTGAFAPTPAVEGLEGPAVLALLRAQEGTWWAGTANGAARLGAGDQLEPFGLTPETGAGGPITALHQDQTGTLYFGGELGLFQYQPGSGHWYWYSGADHSDQVPDWEPFFPERPEVERNAPAPERVFLPPVRSIRRGPDASLWLGTEAGIARYGAQPVERLTYSVLLEAFPHLGRGPVYCIEADGRGGLWFGTETGLLRFDGTDWWHVGAAGPTRVPRPALPGGVRLRFWRFRRNRGDWQRLDLGSAGAGWVTDNTGPAFEPAAPVTGLLRTDGAAADLGRWQGDAFVPDAEAVPAALRMRFKPEETRIVDGGIPAVPRLPPGRSEWRYLRYLPPEDPGGPEPKSRPAWTMEGQLLPPPEDAAAAGEGRYGPAAPPGPSAFDEAVFAFNPAARVRFEWQPRRPLTVLARLARLQPGEALDPAVLDRVWQAMEQVRPAGVRAVLAVDEEVVRGG